MIIKIVQSFESNLKADHKLELRDQMTRFRDSDTILSKQTKLVTHLILTQKLSKIKEAVTRGAHESQEFPHVWK